jgi:hypothetical protein
MANQNTVAIRKNVTCAIEAQKAYEDAYARYNAYFRNSHDFMEFVAALGEMKTAQAARGQAFANLARISGGPKSAPKVGVAVHVHSLDNPEDRQVWIRAQVCAAVA